MAKARGSSSSDDSASFFFLLAILLVIVVPWSLLLLWSLLFPGRAEVAKRFPTHTEHGLRVRSCQTEEMAKKRDAQIRRLQSRLLFCTRGFFFRVAVLLLLWVWLAWIAMQVQQVLATSSLYQNFDPFAILEVGRGAGAVELKKKFRRLSLQYHPDKNPDPSAADRFMLIKKAYDALADPVGKRNYERYGNPDGPTSVELSVALPSVSKENQGLVLVLFVLFFVIGVPVTMLWCMGGGSDEGSNGVLRATMQALEEGVQASMDIGAAQELLLGSAENAAVRARPEDESELAEISKQLQDVAPDKPGRKASQAPQAAASKAELLFLVHVHRRRELLSVGLAEDLDTLLPKWYGLVLAMAELAVGKKASADAMRSVLGLHRCIVQAISPKEVAGAASPFLQVPHLSAEGVKLWRKGPHKSVSLPALLELPPDGRRKTLENAGLSDQALMDIDEFAACAPRITSCEASVYVEGEDTVCDGDVATVRVTIVREHVREDEASGAAHAPFFPSACVADAWWLVLVFPGKKVLAKRFCLTGASRKLDVTRQFRVSSLGKQRCTLYLMSEAYAGLDIERQVAFEVKRAPAEGAGKKGKDSDDNGADHSDGSGSD
mmetsp:Transcript_75845/g.214446  ORF Transcript_75845/g.214446 Transcript_75845/m.214446 type:complete len:606 (-) Transcript_75845:77-1894(-)